MILQIKTPDGMVYIDADSIESIHERNGRPVVRLSSGMEYHLGDDINSLVDAWRDAMRPSIKSVGGL